MIFSNEVMLTLLLVGIYLFDCLILLYSDELLLERRLNNRWHPLFGSNKWLLAQKEPLLLNPATPWRLVLRRRWYSQSANELEAGEQEINIACIDMAAKFATLLMVMMIVILPIFLLVVPVTLLKITVIICCYALVISVIVSLARNYKPLGISKAECIKICFEAVACPPLCINLPRKFYLKSKISLLDFSIFAPSDRSVALTTIKERANHRLLFVDNGSAECNNLHALLNQIDLECVNDNN